MAHYICSKCDKLLPSKDFSFKKNRGNRCRFCLFEGDAQKYRIKIAGINSREIRCGSCGKEKGYSGFFSDRSRFCIECRLNVNLHSFFRQKARQELYKARKRNEIKKTNVCETCGESPAEFHHEDYSKPLEFIELCRLCHNSTTWEDRLLDNWKRG